MQLNWKNTVSQVRTKLNFLVIPLQRALERNYDNGKKDEENHGFGQGNQMLKKKTHRSSNKDNRENYSSEGQNGHVINSATSIKSKHSQNRENLHKHDPIKNHSHHSNKEKNNKQSKLGVVLIYDENNNYDCIKTETSKRFVSVFLILLF